MTISTMAGHKALVQTNLWASVIVLYLLLPYRCLCSFELSDSTSCRWCNGFAGSDSLHGSRLSSRRLKSTLIWKWDLHSAQIASTTYIVLVSGKSPLPTGALVRSCFLRSWWRQSLGPFLGGSATPLNFGASSARMFLPFLTLYLGS